MLLYTIWFAFPALFFAMALWAKLEQLGRSTQRQNPGDFFRQGVFLTFCSIAAVLADKLLLTRLHNTVITEWLPLGVCQALLLPAIWLIAALIAGGSAPISIRGARKNIRTGRQSQVK